MPRLPRPNRPKAKPSTSGTAWLRTVPSSTRSAITRPSASETIRPFCRKITGGPGRIHRAHLWCSARVGCRRAAIVADAESEIVKTALRRTTFAAGVSVQKAAHACYFFRVVLIQVVRLAGILLEVEQEARMPRAIGFQPKMLQVFTSPLAIDWSIHALIQG